MDRICLIKMNYQNEDEEQEIVRLRTGVDEPEIIELAVKMVRKTREHQDVKLGASIRGAIDVVDLFAGMQKLADQPDGNFLTAAHMAVSNKIWLKEMATKTSDEIIEEVWASLRGQYKTLFTSSQKEAAGSLLEEEIQEKVSEEEGRAEKKTMIVT